MQLLAIDPGGCAGWALYETTPLRSEQHKATLKACGIWEKEYSDYSKDRPRPDRVIVEVPQIWPNTPNKQDIITLAYRLGRYVQWIGCDDITEVYPVTWKGDLSKAVHQPRIWDKLRPDEQEVLRAAGKGMAPSKRHNMIDAVGLGLYGVGRKA